MQMYLMRKSKHICSIIFYIFYPCLDKCPGEFYPWRIFFMENFIQSKEFCLLRNSSSLVQKILFSAVSLETLIQCRDIYPVRRLLSSAQTFTQCLNFYPVGRLLSSAQTFIQWVDFYPARRLLFSVETFIISRHRRQNVGSNFYMVL